TDGAVTLIGGKAGRIVVVHAGDQGSRVYQMGICGIEVVAVPPFHVDAVDPTGAGDCFDAGFLVRWLAGAHPVDAARYANACGALACTEKGPMAGAKSAAEVEAFMQRYRG
ncbi:MAG: carbohydrate kinase family protein, partial [Anaerolinea sp.]|nr:carbohydrate kinase family protein [Anaerolinea sp.]